MRMFFFCLEKSKSNDNNKQMKTETAWWNKCLIWDAQKGYAQNKKKGNQANTKARNGDFFRIISI